MKLFNFLFGDHKKKQSKAVEETVGLYYDRMGGAEGHIFCTECSFIVLVDVVKFDYRLFALKTSYQCLSCGEFKNTTVFKNEAIPNCSCGGVLNNKHKLFCPKCKGDKLQYTVYYFT
jgi:hypothetical protein